MVGGLPDLVHLGQEVSQGLAGNQFPSTIRSFLVKLMDMSDLIMTRELQGAEAAELSMSKKMRRYIHIDTKK